MAAIEEEESQVTTLQRSLILLRDFPSESKKLVTDRYYAILSFFYIRSKQN